MLSDNDLKRLMHNFSAYGFSESFIKQRFKQLATSDKKGIGEHPGNENLNVDDKSLDFDDQALLKKQLDNIQSQVQTLQIYFNEKIMEDQHKNTLFDNLHKRLTEYQNGLTDKVINSMAMDVIQLIDAIKKNIDVYEKKETNEENYKKLLGCLKGVTEDLSDILYRQSIESYSVPGSEVDAKRQKIIQIVGTDNEALNNTVAMRTADGFEKEGKVIRPERIKIYKYDVEIFKKV